jgi:hypothetical protein
MVHGESLYLHGSAASRMLGKPETGIPACIAVTLVDGLVLSRSAFDHSMKLAATLAPESLKAPHADLVRRLQNLDDINK